MSPWRDRILGILLGLVIGIVAVAVFVFVFSEETVDAPSLEGGSDSPALERGER